MAIIHIVLIEFKPTLHLKQVQDACRRLIALSQNCVHPETNKPYFKTFGGGEDNSPEGHQGGLTHGFVSEFASKEDRDYYVSKDPVHLEFIASLADLVQGLRVLDYEPGVF